MRLPLRIVAGAGIFLLLSACNYIPGLGAPATSTPTPAPLTTPTHTLTPTSDLEGTAESNKNTGTARPDAQRATIRLTTSLDTVYYPVIGETTQEIFASMEANAPDSEAVAKGRFAAGLTDAESSYE